MLSWLFWCGFPFLFSSLTQYEQLKAHHGAGAAVGASPVGLGSGERKEVDILRMLTKARDEYTKVSLVSLRCVLKLHGGDLRPETDLVPFLPSNKSTGEIQSLSAFSRLSTVCF